jgi:hypothetical protein
LFPCNELVGEKLEKVWDEAGACWYGRFPPGGKGAEGAAYNEGDDGGALLKKFCISNPPPDDPGVPIESGCLSRETNA